MAHVYIYITVKCSSSALSHESEGSGAVVIIALAFLREYKQASCLRRGDLRRLQVAWLLDRSLAGLHLLFLPRRRENGFEARLEIIQISLLLGIRRVVPDHVQNGIEGSLPSLPRLHREPHRRLGTGTGRCCHQGS